MLNYFYIAKTRDGDTKTGVLTAESEKQVAQIVKDKGLLMIQATLQEKKSKWHRLKWSISSRVPAQEMIMFTKNLGVMIDTGLSLVKGFGILSSQVRSKKFKNALIDVKESLNKGEKISEAMSRYPSIFSDLFVNMINAGESSGTLEDSLKVLAIQLEREHNLKSKIRNAMVYPSIILVAMAIVGTIVIVFVLPNLETFFNTLGAEVPLTTRILFATGKFLSTHWYLLIVVPVAVVFMIIMAFKNKTIKKGVDYILLRFPVLSPIIKKNNSALFIRSLSSLMVAGISMNRSLEICSKSSGNYYFKKAIIRSREQIEKGDKLSETLKQDEDLFPFGVVEMIEVGEETGKTSDILKKLADFYEQEAIFAIEKLTTMIEPVLIVVLGVSVGLFAISIIHPMYSSLKFIS